MSMFCPDYIFKSVDRISPQFLCERGIRALVLDVDNTLTAHDSQDLAPGVADWIEQMRAAGIAPRISSNNTAARVRPFAEKLGLPFVSFSLKPASRGLRIARKAFGVSKSEMALVGDQVFTDMLAAKFYGITVLMVQPVAPDFKWNIRLKRVLERPFLARYYKKGGKLYE